MSGFSAAPTRARTQMLEAVRTSSGTFDVDAYHVMDERDNTLIAQEVLHGTGSSTFVYSFEVSGKTVTGISVIGARHLAANYGGIKHRLLASVSKVGSLFTFTSYPQPGMPMSVDAQVIEALAGEDDYYEVLIEVSDIKTGNTIQMRKRESAFERKRDGSKYARPHYSVIAEAKAYRNAVLALIDQGVQQAWKVKMLALNKDEVITPNVLDEKRALVLRFAASKSIPLDRRLVEALTLDQIAGLGDAARGGGADDFRNAAQALRVMVHSDVVTQQAEPAAAKPAGRLASDAAAAPAQRAATAPANEPAGKPASPPPAAQAPAQAPAGYEAYLVDQYGEMADGQSRFTSPAAYLDALLALARAAGPAMLTLLENNADEIDAARAADPQAGATFAAEIDALSAAQRAQASPPAAAAAAPVIMPQKEGKPDLSGYLAAVGAALAHIGSGADLAAWQAANEPVIAGLPSITRKAAQKAVQARAEALGIAVAEPAGQTADAAPQPESEQDLYLRLLREVNACQDNAALTALGENTDFNADLDKLPRDLKASVRRQAQTLRQQYAAQADGAGQ